MITIDKGMAHSTINSSTRDTGLYKVGVSGVTFDEHTIRNCFGVFLENVHNCMFPFLDLRNVHSLNMRNCDGNTFKTVLIDDSWVGLKLNFQCSNNRFEEVTSTKAKDLSSPSNGDGIVIDNPDCVGNWFGKVICSDNSDSGLDQQGLGTIIEDYYAGAGNLHGSKLWGTTIIKKYVSDGAKGNSVLCVSGEHTLEKAILLNAASHHVKLGLSAYATLKKKLTITGVADKWPSFSKDANSTLIESITVGVSLPTEPIGGYETMYNELLVKYDALRADLETAINSANAQASVITSLQAEVDGLKSKLEQIKGIIG